MQLKSGGKLSESTEVDIFPLYIVDLGAPTCFPSLVREGGGLTLQTSSMSYPTGFVIILDVRGLCNFRNSLILLKLDRDPYWVSFVTTITNLFCNYIDCFDFQRHMSVLWKGILMYLNQCCNSSVLFSVSIIPVSSTITIYHCFSSSYLLKRPSFRLGNWKSIWSNTKSLLFKHLHIWKIVSFLSCFTQEIFFLVVCMLQNLSFSFCYILTTEVTEHYMMSWGLSISASETET